MPFDRLELPCRLSQDDFNTFARLSGDHNPIHVDPTFAASTPFGATVSHGMLLYSLLQAALLANWRGAEVSLQQLMFPAPSYAGEDLTLVLEPMAESERSTRVRMQVRKPDGRLGLDGEAVLHPASPAATALAHPVAGDPATGSAPSSAVAEPADPTTAAPLAPAPTRAADTPAIGLPRFQALTRGQSATLERTFTASDLDTWVALAGSPGRPAAIPGPLIGALFSCLLGESLPGHGTNYLKQSLALHHAARVGESLHATVMVSRLRGDKALVDLDTTCHGEDGRLVCSGRALVRFHH